MNIYENIVWTFKHENKSVLTAVIANQGAIQADDCRNKS